ncbi:unnamed protein product [Kluyveromyces dobzhanskii CBS 2104]|uniref:Lysine--tRNA ligase n=1 Tax=Kluyveromyces dobzhanskii CBS 2104 TaxID=1427455 RepID=A0A0A8LBJ1_9SACH|nr:unnamed protein product [Kluyveromyces dobzhanskii CBS 2104]
MLRAHAILRTLRRLHSTEAAVLEYTTRNAEILKNLSKWYPSLSNLPKPTTDVSHFIKQYRDLKEDDRSVSHVLQGKITNVRFSGTKIGFINLWNSNESLQLIVNFSNLSMPIEEFKKHLRQFKIGDHIQVSGFPGVSQRQGTLSLKVTSALQMLAPAQQPVPPKLVNPSKRNSNKVLDYLVNGTKPLLIRHKITKRIREWLYKQDFIEVETPIISGKSNGANAKPFITHCTAINKEQPFELRIAPELWLKRLCIGGMDKIFEIGKVFRNEGIDSTHNPEFTTLEFYQCYINMEQLIEMSESLLVYVCQGIDTPRAKTLLQQLEANNWKFKRLEFLPTLTDKTGIPFETLDLNNAILLKEELAKANIHISPSSVSPQQILDELCGKYIESQCNTLIPTIIYHHPTVLSPLAKTDPNNVQITKRFEIFINGKEYINAYEEENCPDLQLEKFTNQREAKNQFNDDEMMAVDLPYVQAMKYGMPPIGGFGLGIDRLCMLLADTQRIEEVLTFGTLDDVNRQ